MLPSSLLLLFCVSSLQSTNTPRTPHTMNAFESVLRTKNRNQRQIFEQMCYSKLNAKYCKAGSETCLINSSRPILRYGLVYFACDIIPVWCTAKHNLNYDQKVQSVKVLLTTIFMVVWVFPICRIYQKTYKNAPDVDRPKRSNILYIKLFYILFLCALSNVQFDYFWTSVRLREKMIQTASCSSYHFLLGNCIEN